MDFTDEAIFSVHVKNALPIDGQPEYELLARLTTDGAQVLDIPVPPRVYVKNDDTVNAYVTGLDAPHILVVTSGLWELYKERPEELRFVVGHELGHIKCDHVHAMNVIRFLVEALGAQGENSVAGSVIAPLLALDLFYWSRAAELSADRAGLVCVGHSRQYPQFNRRIAEQAMVRLLHGGTGEIDVDRFLEQISQDEQRRPVANALTILQELGRTHPFIVDRCRKIRAWSRSTNFTYLLERDELNDSSRRLIVESVSFSNLPATDADVLGSRQACDAVLVLGCGRDLRRSGPVIDSFAPRFNSLDWSLSFVPNTRVVIDVLDSDFSGEDLIGSVVVSPSGSSNYVTGTLQLNGFEDNTADSQVTVKYRIED